MADRYWVGGAGTWSSTNTANWSTSSGGASGASVPTSADNVFFDSASNATAYTVTLASNFVGTASYSSITSMTSTVTVATVTSGALAVGNLIYIGSIIFRITSFGTGTGGVGTYNCSCLRGANGTGQATTAAHSPAPICADISFSGPTAGSLGWVVTNSGIEITGSLTVAASGVTMSPTLYMSGSSTHTITTNSVNISALYLVGTGTFTLGTAFTTNGTLYFSLGTFSTNNFNLTCSVFDQSSSGTRTINLGSSTVNITGSSYPTGSQSVANGWANVTFNAGTSQVNFSGNLAFYINFGNKTWYNVSMTATTISQNAIGITLGYTVSDNPTFNNFSIAGQTQAGLANIFLNANLTINGTFTIGAATSAVTRLMVLGKTLGTVKTITAAAFAAGATDVDWRDITIAGAAGTISGTRFGNCGGCTNITFDAAKTVYWNLSGAQNWSATGWATASGGSPSLNNFPLAQDAAVFDNTGSVTGTITINSNWNIGTLDTSTRTNAMTLASGSTSPAFYGNFTYGSGVTPTGTGTFTFANRSTKTLDSGGKTFTQSVTINAPGGGIQIVTNSLTLGSTLTTTLTAGTLDLNSLTLSTGIFDGSNTNTRTLAFGTGQINITGTNTTVLTLFSATGLTVTGTPVVNATDSGSVGTRVMQFNGVTSNFISLNVTAGTDSFTITGPLNNLNFTGFSGTWNNNGFSLYGNLTLSSGMTLVAGALTLTFAATSGTKTITTAGKTLDFPITFNGAGGTWQLIDALTMGSTRTLTLTNGTLNLNGQTLTVGTAFSTASGTKNLTFNGGTLVCPTASTTAFNNFVPSGFTTTAGTGTGYIQMTGATAKTFVGNGTTFNCVLQQAGAGALTITGSNSFLDLQATVAGQPSSILFTAATTTTFTNFTLSGTAGNLVTIGSVTAASHTLSKASGTVSVSYLSISRSTATGGAAWYAGTSSTNGGNNTGWIFTAPPSPGGQTVIIGPGVVLGAGVSIT